MPWAPPCPFLQVGPLGVSSCGSWHTEQIKGIGSISVGCFSSHTGRGTVSTTFALPERSAFSVSSSSVLNGGAFGSVRPIASGVSDGSSRAIR